MSDTVMITANVTALNSICLTQHVIQHFMCANQSIKRATNGPSQVGCRQSCRW